MARPSSLHQTDAVAPDTGLPGWFRECVISLALTILLAGLSLGAGHIWQAQGLGWLAAGPLVAALGWCLAWWFVLVRHLHRSLAGALGFWLVQGALWHGSYRDGPVGELELLLLVVWALALAGLAIALLALSLPRAPWRRRLSPPTAAPAQAAS
ncbi:hypothetical protein [Halomonas sp. YLGW01]|uniref:hypothetical protein n=1 Tax=Halomonas sp. YLGW01 TaxID=2773308 RepID=UPI001785D67F|nr:hypothetical protein [Halomonas sp. YLGW01]